MKEIDSWWYGVKEAEQLMNEGYVLDLGKSVGGYLWFIKDSTSCGIPSQYKERIRGAMDYVEHRNKVLYPINGSK